MAMEAATAPAWNARSSESTALGGTGGGYSRAGARRGVRPQTTPAVVVYVSLDEPYSRPVLEQFERDTGTHVQILFDTEANKTRGLAERIIAERNHPRADVFWSSELMQMLVLGKHGALQPYRSPSAEGIPPQFRDPAGHWTAFAARVRVLAYNKQRLSQPPHSLLELTEPRWRDNVAMSNPLFGTTTSEAAALFQLLGTAKAEEYYRQRRANGVRLVDGNSLAVESAARGDVLVGQTDSDDTYTRIDRGEPLGIVFPDQDGMGALLIPNSVGLVAGAPHPELGRKLIDYLLRPETELMLANCPSRQLPLHPGLAERLPEQVRTLAQVKAMKVDYPRLLESYPRVDAFLRKAYLH